MLGACHEVLKTGGRIAGYAIHTRPGLSNDLAALAAEWGPAEVNSRVPYGDLLRETRFRVVLEEDVTARFEATCDAERRAWLSLEEEIRAAEGDPVFEEGLQKKTEMHRGISERLLLRSLHVAIRD